MLLFKNKKKDDTDNLRGDIVKINKKIKNSIDTFATNEGFVIKDRCPSCGAKISIDIYANKKTFNSEGYVLCRNCRSVLNYKIFKFDSDVFLVLNKFGDGKKVNIINDLDNYLIKNVSMDDWKIALNNIGSKDFTIAENLLRRIKNKLEDKGLKF